MRDAFSDLLLGGRCAGCDRRGRVLCAGCAAGLPGSGHEVRPVPAPAGLPPVFAAGEYADPLRRLILAHKERQAFGLAGPLGGVLGQVLVDAVQALRPPPGTVLALVPVPSSVVATRSRGHDPVLRMTRAAGRALTQQLTQQPTRQPTQQPTRLGIGCGRPVVLARLLRIVGPVADQSGLDVAARAANLSGRLAVRASVHRRLARVGGPVLALLCDDVLTTGATLAEAQRALTAAGVPAAAAGTLAATRRRLPRAAGPGALCPGFDGSLPLS